MSWLARSIANSLKINDDDDERDMDNNNDPNSRSVPDLNPSVNSSSSTSSPSSSSSPRGVKEDLSELTKTLTRQFWGVASFLAPPPSDTLGHQPEHEERQSPSDPEKPYDEALMEGIRSDFTEIGGKFRSGILKLSNNISVSDITKIASNFLQFGAERELRDEDFVGTAVGVNEEVVSFVRNITMHPEIWLDFPVPDDEGFEDFDMSDAQQEHALTVERLAPRLAALRIELCPGYMSESLFWKIYFILLHPRLNENDAKLLSTPEIVVARATLSQSAQSQVAAKQKLEESGHESSLTKETADILPEESLSVPSNAESRPYRTSSVEAEPSTIAVDFEGEKHPFQSTEIEVVDKSVIEEGPRTYVKNQHSPSGSSSGLLDVNFEDDWLKEEHSEMIGASGTVKPFTNDEDVSFSDLEEDDGYVPSSYKKGASGSYSSTKESPDWVQLSSADPVKDVSSVIKYAVGAVVLGNFSRISSCEPTQPNPTQPKDPRPSKIDPAAFYLTCFTVIVSTSCLDVSATLRLLFPRWSRSLPSTLITNSPKTPLRYLRVIPFDFWRVNPVPIPEPKSASVRKMRRYRGWNLKILHDK